MLYVFFFAAVGLLLYAYIKSLKPTRERLTFDLQRLRRVMPLDELVAPNFSANDVRRYYSSTTFRDYKLLEWATGCNAMHTELIPERKLPFRSRHLQQLLYVIAHLGSGAVSGGRTLEVGFGKGSNSVFLASLFPDAHFVGLDLVEEHVDYASAYAAVAGIANVAFATGNATDPPAELRASQFDAIFGIESFCHMDSQEKQVAFLDFATEALRPGGRIVVVDGFRADDYNAHDTDVQEAMELAESGFRIMRMPSRATWKALATAHGFDIVWETELTPYALKFWMRGWRVAQLLLLAPALLRRYFASSPQRQETGANFVSVAMTAYAMALGAANYGVLVLQKRA